MKIPLLTSGHPDATQLVELACGDLDPGILERVQRHCLVCDECARQIEALLGLRRICGLELPTEARRAVTGLRASVVTH